MDQVEGTAAAFLKRVQAKVSDGRIIRLLTLYLQQGVLEGMANWTPETGTPQGAVISPLLSNIYSQPFGPPAGGPRN